MNEIHHKQRQMRLSDVSWERFKRVRRESGHTWNMFVRHILNSFIDKDFKKRKKHESKY
jgi:hypothetical protein